MTDSIIWVKPDTAVNLDTIAYIQVKTDEGKSRVLDGRSDPVERQGIGHVREVLAHHICPGHRNARNL